MKRMPLGKPGAERPVVRVDEHSYIDVSDEVRDFDEAFFGSGGLARLPDLLSRGRVAEAAGEGALRPFDPSTGSGQAKLRSGQAQGTWLGSAITLAQ